MSTKTLIKLSLMGLLAFSFASATVYAKAADDDDAEEEAPKKKKKAKKLILRLVFLNYGQQISLKMITKDF